MRKFDPDKYKKYIEDWDDPIIRQHEEDEFKIIKNVTDLKEKTLVDLGAGYGRIIPRLKDFTKNKVAIDINPKMYEELERRSKKYENVKVIFGDITKLSMIINDQVLYSPVFVILENTLGTIEGDYKVVLSEVKEIAKKYKGDVILSLYRQQALKEWGIMTYEHGKEMNGEPALDKTDFENGLFVSKSGYTSKWWTDEEIEAFKRFFGGKLTQEIKKEQYRIFHTKFE